MMLESKHYRIALKDGDGRIEKQVFGLVSESQLFGIHESGYCFTVDHLPTGMNFNRILSDPDLQEAIELVEKLEPHHKHFDFGEFGKIPDESKMDEWKELIQTNVESVELMEGGS